VDEIADGVWNEDATAHQTTGTFGQAIGDPVANTETIYDAVVTDATGINVATDVAGVLDDTGTSGVIVGTNNDKTGYTLTADFRVKKNTALANFMFLMVSDTDHVTPATGLTVVEERSIDGAAFGACANAFSELSDGVYVLDLAAADLNGDVIMFKFTATGADATYVTIVTQTE